MKHTVFLDRDGVINFDSSDYIKSESEFKFIPRSAEAVSLLNKNGFDVIIITNQSAIGRGMITSNGLKAIFDKMKKGIKDSGGEIKDIFFCPHLPNQGCSCRKPKPGLILQAVRKYNIDLSLAYMVGDSAKDIECAKKSGCTSVLVQTGNGKEAQVLLESNGIYPDFKAHDLMDAAKWIVVNKARRARAKKSGQIERMG